MENKIREVKRGLYRGCWDVITSALSILAPTLWLQPGAGLFDGDTTVAGVRAGGREGRTEH